MEKRITNIDQHGRMLIPACVREKLNIYPGDKVTLEIADDSIIIKNVDFIVDELHSIFTKKRSGKTQNVVEDFITDKRADFKIEQTRNKK